LVLNASNVAWPAIGDCALSHRRLFFSLDLAREGVFAATMNAPGHTRREPPRGQRTGLARVLSKLGFSSRRQAWDLIEAGRVRVNGAVRRNPEWRVDLQRDRLEVDGQQLSRAARVYLMLNKPRGLVTTTSDEQGRATVFECLTGQGLPFVTPVGRLDKASEGMLLFTNDTAWSARVASPDTHLDKTYHVQVDCPVAEELLRSLERGIVVDGDRLAAKQASLLRSGGKTSWLEIVLDEGRNRQIRRMLAALAISVLRLVRVAIGTLVLGDLKKGQFRRLTREEVRALGLPNCGSRLDRGA
jgi:23S rRNA pseudouridine2605 synthase